MKEIKVLGTGCSNCRNTIRLIEEVASASAKAESAPAAWLQRAGLESELTTLADRAPRG